MRENLRPHRVLLLENRSGFDDAIDRRRRHRRRPFYSIESIPPFPKLMRAFCHPTPARPEMMTTVRVNLVFGHRSKPISITPGIR